jgi:hypothetical protein
MAVVEITRPWLSMKYSLSERDAFAVPHVAPRRTDCAPPRPIGGSWLASASTALTVARWNSLA